MEENSSRLENLERKHKYQRTMLKQSRRKICTLEQHSQQQMEEQRLVTEAHSAQLEQITHQLPAAVSATSDGNEHSTHLLELNGRAEHSRPYSDVAKYIFDM